MNVRNIQWQVATIMTKEQFLRFYKYGRVENIFGIAESTKQFKMMFYWNLKERWMMAVKYFLQNGTGKMSFILYYCILQYNVVLKTQLPCMCETFIIKNKKCKIMCSGCFFLKKPLNAPMNPKPTHYQQNISSYLLFCTC